VVWVQPCGCVVVSARQGKARRKREAKAKPAQAQICGSPRLGLVCRKGRCRRDDGRWSWWRRRVCLFLNNGLSIEWYCCRRRCCLVLVAGAGRGSFTEGGELGGDLPVPRLSIELPIECTSPSPDLPFTELSAFNCQKYIHPSSCSPHTNHQTHTWKGHMYHTQ
jgi:hypothetical protein